MKSKLFLNFDPADEKSSGFRKSLVRSMQLTKDELLLIIDALPKVWFAETSLQSEQFIKFLQDEIASNSSVRPGLSLFTFLV